MLATYSLTAIGVSVHLHYCMDRFAGWSLWKEKDGKCGKCRMTEKREGCCKDVHKYFKIKDNHQKTGFVLYSPQTLTASVLSPFFKENYNFQGTNHLNYQIHDPP